MALVSDGMFATITVVDGGGNRSTLRYKLTAETVGNAVTQAGVIAGRLAAITDGLVIGYSAGEQFKDDTDAFGAEDSQVENQALLLPLIDTIGHKVVSVKVPAPSPSIFVDTLGPNANVIDSTNVDVQAYLSTWETGNDATLSDGETIKDPSVPGNFSGRRTHRASSRG